MFQRCCGFCMILRTEKSPEYFFNSTKSWYTNQLGFLSGEGNWHWREWVQASYTCLKGILGRENSHLGYHKLQNVSEGSSSQKTKFHIAVAISECIPHTASPLLTSTSLGHTASLIEQKTDRRLTFKAKEEISDLPGPLIFLRISTRRQYQPQHYCAQEDKQGLG